jgi:OOP family OmpA-OmpF porin
MLYNVLKHGVNAVFDVVFCSTQLICCFFIPRKNMIQFAKLAVAVATAAVSLSAAAQEVKNIPAPKNGVYLQDSRDIVTRSGTGLCWQTAYTQGACEPAAPAPAAAAPAPAPAPAPVAAAPTSEKVSYAADAFFDFDKAVLKPAGKQQLDELAANLKNVDLEVIVAVGHTDSTGPKAYNQKLSERRAEAVKAYLTGKGIDANRIYTEGKGSAQPVADNRTKEGRAKNRFVGIEVVGRRTN